MQKKKRTRNTKNWGILIVAVALLLVNLGIYFGTRAMHGTASTAPTLYQPSGGENWLYQVPERNLDNVRFEEIRKTLDPVFNKMHDDLSIAYYNYWRYGLSQPWLGYDVRITKEESKAQFDKLHGLLFKYYYVSFHNLNISQPILKQIPQADYNMTVYDDFGIAKGTVVSTMQGDITKASLDGYIIAVPNISLPSK